MSVSQHRLPSSVANPTNYIALADESEEPSHSREAPVSRLRTREMGTPLTGVAYGSPAFLMVERMSPTCTRQPAERCARTGKRRAKEDTQGRGAIKRNQNSAGYQDGQSHEPLLLGAEGKLVCRSVQNFKDY